MGKVHVRSSPAKISLSIPPPPRGGDSFSALYRKHRAFVRAFLRRRGFAAADADDLTQDVFAVAHRRGVYPPTDGQARAWLWAIALRVGWNHRQLRRHRVERGFAEVPDLLVDPRVVERLDAASWIRRAIERLSPKLRVVFVALEIEGRAIVDIANALGIGLKAAWSRMKLARDELLRWVGGRASLVA